MSYAWQGVIFRIEGYYAPAGAVFCHERSVKAVCVGGYGEAKGLEYENDIIMGLVLLIGELRVSMDLQRQNEHTPHPSHFLAQNTVTREGQYLLIYVPEHLIFVKNRLYDCAVCRDRRDRALRHDGGISIQFLAKMRSDGDERKSLTARPSFPYKPRNP